MINNPDESLEFSDHILLKRVLMPYKANCHYLNEASVMFSKLPLIHSSIGQDTCILLAKGNFSIPESCYIINTGHFNAVEFNICYNQLGYYLLAECIRHRLFCDFLDWDIEEFIKHQLTNILIIELFSSFHRLMNADKFTGYIEIKKIIKMEKILYLETVCGFKDNNGGYATGKVLIAFVLINTNISIAKL